MEKKKCFEVSVYFEGVMNYTVEAESEEDAKSQADAMFNEENSEVVFANIAQTTTTVDMEVDAVQPKISES